MRLLLVFLSATTVAASAVARAQGPPVFEPHTWVVVTDWGVRFTRGDTVVGPAEFGSAYQVTRQEEDLLWIERMQAYLRASDVTRYEDVLPRLTARIRREPTSGEAYHDRGIILWKRGKLAEAAADLDRAIALAPDDAGFHVTRGHVRNAKGDNRGALADFDEAIRLEPPGSTAAWNGRGTSHQRLGDREAAIRDYTRAIDVDPGHCAAWTNRGYSRWASGDSRGAVGDYSEAIRLAPRDPIAWRFRGMIRFNLGEQDAALADFQTAIDLAPGEIDALLDRAEGYTAVGRYREALTDYTEAVRKRPGAATAFNSRAALLATCPDDRYRDGRLALSDARIACELTKYQDYRTLKTLAAAHAELGEFQEAVRWQKKALELSPDSAQPQSARMLRTFESGRPYRTRRKPVEAPR